MDPTLELLAKRRSLRQYDPTPLTPEEKNAILSAAMRAPTGCNMMLYAIIEVADPIKKARLAETCNHQPFIAKAPYMLLFVADYQRWMDLHHLAGSEARAIELGIPTRQPAEGELVMAVIDAIIAAHTAVIAAEALGIGSCYIGNVMENWEIHREMFDLPRYTLPAVLVCFGKPAKLSRGRKTSRFEPRFIVHQDSYKRFSPEELDEMFVPFGKTSFEQKKYSNGAQNMVQANYLQDLGSEANIEITRSIQEMIKSWKGN